MKCPNCGREIADDSKFCDFCGTKIEEKKISWMQNKIYMYLMFALIMMPILSAFRIIQPIVFLAINLIIICIVGVLMYKQKISKPYGILCIISAAPVLLIWLFDMWFFFYNSSISLILIAIPCICFIIYHYAYSKNDKIIHL